MSASGE